MFLLFFLFRLLGLLETSCFYYFDLAFVCYFVLLRYFYFFFPLCFDILRFLSFYFDIFAFFSLCFDILLYLSFYFGIFAFFLLTFYFWTRFSFWTFVFFSALKIKINFSPCSDQQHLSYSHNKVIEILSNIHIEHWIYIKVSLQRRNR